MNAISQLYRHFNKLRGRRIFILPTRFGFLYACFLLLILLAAINYSNSLGHILCFLLASMGQLAVYTTYRNLAKIDLLNAYSEPCFLGQTIAFHCRFNNPNSRDSHHLNVASKHATERSWNPFKNLTGYLFQAHQSIDLLISKQTTVHRITVMSTHRGQQALGQVRLSTHFPLGLFDTWTYFKPDCFALVYPTPIGRLPLPSTHQEQLGYKESQHKGYDDFSGLHTYREGDATHAIAWKAMARDDILRIKQFSSNPSGRLVLAWQDTASLLGTEARLSQLCRWIIDADAQSLEYGLVLPKLTIDIGQGHSHQHRCLTALALYD